MRRQRHFNPTAHLVLGVMLILWGVLFTLDNLHVLHARDYVRLWPVALIAFGVVQMLQARSLGGGIGASIWVVFGSLFLANNLGYIHANVWSYWPLVLVLVGGRMIGQAFYRSGPPGGAAMGRATTGGATMGAGAAGGATNGGTTTGGTTNSSVFGAAPTESGSVMSAVAVMGRVDRRITSHEFQHGEITAFMGGCRLDLRDAQLAGGQAVINVVAMMGGCEILIPPSWHVVNELTPFMGGVDDKRRSAAGPADAPQLLLRGFVVMGGVEIKD